MSDAKPHDLHDFMRQLSVEMAAEYERIQRRAAEDPGTAGDQGEENWAELLKGWLPNSYTVVTKGRLIGSDGQTSPQVDVLVLKGSYPPKLRDKKLYLAAGVAAAFECKTTLKASHITEAVKTCVKVKELLRSRSGTPYKELYAPMVYGLLAHSHSWNRPNSMPAERVSDTLVAADAEYVNHPRQCLDLICVANLGSWDSSKASFIGPQQIDYQRNRWAHSLYGPNGSAQSIFMKHMLNGGVGSATTAPVGSALSYLMRRLAWEDPTLRDLADYYVETNLDGSGSGVPRMWPSSIYSESIRKSVEAGHLSNGAGWDEWSVFFH